MTLWVDSNNVLHDDMDGAALTLAAWPTGLSKATQAQIDAITAPIPIPLKNQALAELNKVTGASGTIIRCVIAGIAVPSAWADYIKALRAIANGTDTTSIRLPTMPAYPEGA